MFTGKPISVKSPSRKPLPALPTENSKSDDSAKSLSPSTSTSSHSIASVQGPGVLPLDSVSLGHIRKMLQQSLNNCSIENDPWESIILGIILDVSETVPKAIETISQHEFVNYDFISSKKNVNEKIDDNDKQKNDSSSIDDQNNSTNDPRFIIKLKVEESGKPTDSHFIYNFFDGEYLYKYENIEEPNKDLLKNWMGGTIILKGTKKYANRVDKVLELMTYVMCNLRLEVYLFKDHSVLREDTKDGQDAEDVQKALRNSRRTSKSSWLGWLMKHNNIPSIKEQIIKSYEKIEKYEKYEKNEKTSLIRRVSTKRNSFSKPSTSPSPSPSPSSTVIDVDEDDGIVNLSANKFASVIHQMEKAILSSSPGVKFPPPHLLTRLRDEETEIRLHTKYDGTFKSYIAKDALDLASDFSNENGTISSTGKYRTYAISKSNQVSLDFQSGLAYLMMNNNSLNGVFKHQSLSCSYSRFWSPTSILPCDNHKILTMEYYNKNSDKSLGAMINWFCDQAYEICQDSSCDHPGIDHIVTYTHDTGRISITLEELSDSSTDPFDNNKIFMWTVCKQCSKKTQTVQMSPATYLYSFGKYLEILFYNEDFYCKTLCPHVESRDSMVRCFHRGNLIVKIEYEQIDLFEMRLPKLQISQEETPIYNSLGEAERIDKLFVIDTEDAKRLLDETRLEITYFYGAVKQHITALEEYFDSLSLNEKRESNSNINGIKDDSDKEGQDYLKILDDMTTEFRQEEFDLYSILKNTKATVLNDVRKLLVERINSTKKRLLDWQKAHVLERDLEKFSNIDWVEPEYASSSNCHVFPGSPIIIRENEPSSIIALTLSSRDYLRELSLMRQNVRLSLSQSAPVTPTSETNYLSQTSSSFSTLISSLKNDGVNGDNGIMVDQYSSNIRRKYVKEPQSGLSDRITYGIESLGKPFNLSLSRDKRKDSEKDVDKQSTSKSSGKFIGIFGQKNEDPEKLNDGNTENENDKNINSGKEDKKPKTATDKEDTKPKTATDKEDKKPKTTTDSEKLSNEKKDSPEKEVPKKKEDVTASPSSTFVDGFSWSRKPQKEKDSQHLKYQCTHGNKKFSCTVYYATQFDSLRRRCGIENLCIDSLSRCSSWEVTGGKSSSNFFKTKDDRLVIKQMVSSWKIGEMDALLKFAPKYFKYMDKPPSSPSVLAKIFGVYTIKIKDTKKNNVIMKMDILVMEHLFFEKTITRKFDLKGIQERHTKDKAQKEDATLWDGDWVEGRYKSLLLIHSHSKKIIREAILNDTQFLTDSNIMDYSLLVGVDDEKKELVAGIVDFIGAYTLYKKIENRGKTIGRNAKEVTVLPPDQYKDRFRDSIDQYFLAVPDKWIKSQIIDDNPLSPSTEEQALPISPSSTQPPPTPIRLKLPSVL